MARRDPVEGWILRWRTPELVEFSEQIKSYTEHFFCSHFAGEHCWWSISSAALGHAHVVGGKGQRVAIDSGRLSRL
jgi:hypothetical protein